MIPPNRITVVLHAECAMHLAESEQVCDIYVWQCLTHQSFYCNSVSRIRGMALRKTLSLEEQGDVQQLLDKEWNQLQLDTLVDGLIRKLNTSTYRSRDDIVKIAVPWEVSESLKRAISIYHHRRRRETIFGSDLFGDPAWDMLLDLFIAFEEGRSISLTNLCIDAGVPATTTFRWVALLEDRGFIDRETDQAKSSGRYLSISRQAWEMMNQYLSEL